METQSLKVLSTEDDMDSETLQLLQENDQIVGEIEDDIRPNRPKLSPEELAAKVDKIYNALQEIFARARAQNAASEVNEEAAEEVESVEVEPAEEVSEEEVMMTESENMPDMPEETESEENEDLEPAVLCLRNIRESRGWNQKEAAEKLGISQGLVSQVESGRTPMSKKLKAKLESLPPASAA